MSTDGEAIPAADFSRRAFFKKCVAAGFAVPVIVSFTLDGVVGALEPAAPTFPNQAVVNACLRQPPDRPGGPPFCPDDL